MQVSRLTCSPRVPVKCRPIPIVSFAQLLLHSRIGSAPGVKH
jgi:hypothetical protein